MSTAFAVLVLLWQSWTCVQGRVTYFAEWFHNIIVLLNMGTPLIACLHANWVNVNLPGYHAILYNVHVCNSYITGPRFVAILLHCKSMRAFTVQ